MASSPKVRAAIFAMFDGHCAYCGELLPEKGWHEDHVEPVYREWYKALRPKTTAKWCEATQSVIQVETDRKVTMAHPERDCLENKFPSCRPCNINKSAESLESWRKCLEQTIRVLRDNHAVFRHAERFGLVTAMEAPKVVFYFEKIAALQLPPTPPGTN